MMSFTFGNAVMLGFSPPPTRAKEFQRVGYTNWYNETRAFAGSGTGRYRCTNRILQPARVRVVTDDMRMGQYGREVLIATWNNGVNAYVAP